jgi:hypothetical protein
MRISKRRAGAFGAALALTLGIAGTAHADAYQWQNYTRDGSWNCGPAGSTQHAENLYLLACVKVSYGDWQAVLIATTTGASGYLHSHQIEWDFTGGTHKVQEGDCNPVDLDPTEILPNSSAACFSPTTYSPNSLVEGEFKITVASDPLGDDPQTLDIYSPGVWTTS